MQILNLLDEATGGWMKQRVVVKLEKRRSLGILECASIIPKIATHSVIDKSRVFM